MFGDLSTRRALTPAVGIVLLVAIVLLIATIASYMIFGLSDTNDPAPEVAVDLIQRGDGFTYQLEYHSGSATLGNKTELFGVVDEEVLHGEDLRAGQEIEVIPIAEEVKLIWYEEDTSYTLHTFTVEAVPFEADHRCEWAQKHINNQGDLDLKDDTLICDIVEEVDLNPGVNDIDVDLDNATLVGTIDTDGDVDLDESTVVGGVTTDADDITMTDESTVYGDVVAQSDTNIDIDGDSTIEGAVVAKNGDVDLDGVTVTGHVYVDDGAFSCSGDSTLGPNEEDCSEYDSKDPGDY